MAEPLLPAFLDPLLDYLSDVLPPPIYFLVDTLLANWVALISSLYTLALTLISSSPTSWDFQTLIPPLITLLSAYLALLTFYRTASWFLRTIFAFIKWGIIFSLLGMGAGYLLANFGSPGSAIGALMGGAGVLSTLGGYVFSLLSGMQNGGDNTRGFAVPKWPKVTPQAWESQDRQWQKTQGEEENEGSDGNVQQVILNILGGAGQAVQQSGWWEAAKGVAEDFSRTAQANVAKEGEKQQERKTRSKSKRTTRSQARSQKDTNL